MTNRNASPVHARHPPKGSQRRKPRPRTWGRAQRVEYEEDGGVPYTVMANEEDSEKLGFTPSGFPPDRVFIKHVEHESWAEQQGIVNGDELMAVDGKDIRMLNDEEFESILTTRPIMLTLRCGPKQLESDGVPLQPHLDLDDKDLMYTGHDGFDPVHETEAHDMMPFTVTLTKEDRKMGWAPSALPPQRVFVKKVEKISWAQHEGIQVGDELLTVGGKQCAAMTADKFQKKMQERPLVLAFRGKGNGRKALEGGEDGDKPDKPAPNVEYTGIAPEAALGFTPRIVVSEVQQGGWADKHGLVAGDTLVSINGFLLSQLFEDAEAVKKAFWKRPGLITFLRSGSASMKNAAVQVDNYEEEKRKQEEAELAEMQRAIDERRQNFDAFRNDDSSDDGRLIQRRFGRASAGEAEDMPEEEDDGLTSEDDYPPPPVGDELIEECWVKLGNAVIASETFGSMPVTRCRELWLQHLRHGAFTGLQMLNTDCEIQYWGPRDEDLALKVFKGTAPKDPGSFHFVGYIHLMQDLGKHTVKVQAEGRHYYLGLEVVRGLNRDVLSESTVADPLGRHKDLAKEFQQGCETSADDADFLVYFTSRDASLNNACLQHLINVGVRFGPWAESPRRVAVCTDVSLGLGRHFGDQVSLRLGNHEFAQVPPEDTSAEAWLEDLEEMSRRTQFGVLLLNPSTRYLRASGCRTECRLIPGNRQYVYDLREDRIMLLSEHAGHRRESRSKLLEVAARGNMTAARAILEGDPLSCICDVNEADDTALHVASLKGQRDLTKMLLEAGADPNAQNCWGSTPLHAAIVGGDEVNLLLLLEFNAEIDIQDNQGNTVLHLAASRGLERMVTRLLDMNADAEWQNADGDTALALAALWGHVGTALLLRDAEDVDDIRNAEYLQAKRAKESEEEWSRQHEKFAREKAERAAEVAALREDLNF